ncbi:hypothetical protein ACFRIB_48085 [Streptomyces mirabilis]|uniref:hypothetical protein n=1 Tax=Streptomyces mirabilis TaxID=68239 RepID=UPI003694D859
MRHDPGLHRAGPLRHCVRTEPLQEDFAEEARQAPDPGAPRRAAAELGDVGQVRSWLTGRDIMDTCVKNHKGVISRRSAFMVVLMPQLIRLEIEAPRL